MIQNQSSKQDKDGRRISLKMERLSGILRLHDGVTLPDRGDGGLHHLCREKKLLCTQVCYKDDDFGMNRKHQMGVKLL